MMHMVKYCQSTVLEAIIISILSKLTNRVYIKKLAYDFHKFEQFTGTDWPKLREITSK